MPQARPWIAWDTDVTGFGVKVHPTGTKSFVLNYRARSGGRRARNRRVVIGRTRAGWRPTTRGAGRGSCWTGWPWGRTPARRGPTAVRRLPTLAEAFEEYLTANPDRKEQTARFYRALMRNCLGDWLARPLSTIARRDVEARFLQVSRRRGRTVGNHAHLAAALGVPPALRGLRRACATPSSYGSPGAGATTASSGGASPRRPRCCRGGAGDRGGGHRAGDARHLLVRALHGPPRQRGVRPELGPGEPLAAPPAGRRDQDRETAAPAGHPAARRRPRAAAGRLSR